MCRRSYQACSFVSCASLQLFVHAFSAIHEQVDGTYQRPWMVHESEGPVEGAVSQNCVNSTAPPGASKQQRSSTIVVFEQLKGRSAGQMTDDAATEPATARVIAILDNIVHYLTRLRRNPFSYYSTTTHGR